MRYLLAGVLAFSLLLVSGATAKAAKPKGNKPKATPEERFKKLDKDNSGTLSEVEFIGKRAGDKAEAAKKMFQKKDKDTSGSLTLAEFTAKGKGKKKNA
jgi:Ca2+-binding EF-hand superfamily protein